MRIFAAGIATETNTFCPIPATLDDFNVQRGRDVLAGRIAYPELDLSLMWGVQAKERGDEFIFSLNASSQPLGITTRSVYEALRDELLGDLKAALPVDIVLLMLHGAMIADGYEDSEQDLISRVRAIAGPEAVIAVEFDLHCHLTPAHLSLADLIITYKEYPHVDINERSRELFELAVAARLGHIRPTMALFDCRMVGLYPTTREPLRRAVDAMIKAERRDGVLSISFAHSFPFADVPRLGAKVLVITDDDAVLAEHVAHRFGSEIYALRREIGFESLSLPMEQALSQAVASQETPVVVADQSDNVGAGAPGDATFALRWLLEQHAKDCAVAIVHDPEVVKIARRAGCGARTRVRLGGKIGSSSGDPLDIEVNVLAVRERYMQAFPQRSGNPIVVPVGDVVAVHCAGIDIIVGSERCQCYSPAIFSDLGIDAAKKRVLVVKSAQHFYAAFAPVAARVIYMAAPGAVAPDPRQILYRRVNTQRLYPWADDPLSLAD